LSVLLNDIAEIQTGVFAKTNYKGDVVYLQVNDFDEFGNHIGYWEPTLMHEELNPKHFLHKGDVLFAAKGSKNFAAVRNSDTPLAVASTSFFVIRIHDNKVMPEFLCWYLNQPDIQYILKSKARGTAIPSITKKPLENVEIPMLTLDKQKLILKIDSLRQKQRLILQKITLLKDHLIQQQVLKAVNK